MTALQIVLLVCQLISSAALVLIVMFQTGKENGLGALTGNSDNYFGKNKAATLDAKLSRMTKWVAAVFVILTFLVAMIFSV